MSGNKKSVGIPNTKIDRSKANLEKGEVWDFIIGRSGPLVEVEAQRDMLSGGFLKLEQ